MRSRTFKPWRDTYDFEPWYAWRPVAVTVDDAGRWRWVWLETVGRRQRAALPGWRTTRAADKASQQSTGD